MQRAGGVVLGRESTVNGRCLLATAYTHLSHDAPWWMSPCRLRETHVRQGIVIYDLSKAQEKGTRQEIAMRQPRELASISRNGRVRS